MGTVLSTGPTFTALRRRLLLRASPAAGCMRLLALTSCVAQQHCTGTGSEALASLGATLRELLTAQHAKEEGRAAKSPYLQALVQAIVSVEGALGGGGREGGAGAAAGPWLADVRAAVEMLSEVSHGQLPLRLLAGEFLPRVRAEQGVVLQVRPRGHGLGFG